MATNYTDIRYTLGVKRARIIATFLLALALLGAQAILLHHHHDGDISSHVDCSVCIKQSSETDFLPTVLDFSSPIKSAGVILADFEPESSVTLLTIRSRGPPLVNS